MRLATFDGNADGNRGVHPQPRKQLLTHGYPNCFVFPQFAKHRLTFFREAEEFPYSRRLFINANNFSGFRWKEDVNEICVRKRRVASQWIRQPTV
jgi:hypothetical protein